MKECDDCQVTNSKEKLLLIWMNGTIGLCNYHCFPPTPNWHLRSQFFTPLPLPELAQADMSNDYLRAYYLLDTAYTLDC